jgi:hypothetical protein
MVCSTLLTPEVPARDRRPVPAEALVALEPVRSPR